MNLQQVEMMIGMPLEEAVRDFARSKRESDEDGERLILIFEELGNIRNASIHCNAIASNNGHPYWKEWLGIRQAIEEWEGNATQVELFEAYYWQKYAIDEEPVEQDFSTQLMVYKQAMELIRVRGNVKPIRWYPVGILSNRIRKFWEARRYWFYQYIDNGFSPWDAREKATAKAKDLWMTLVNAGMGGERQYSGGTVVRPEGVIDLYNIDEVEVYAVYEQDFCTVCGELVDLLPASGLIEWTHDEEGHLICEECTNPEELIGDLIEEPIREEMVRPIPTWMDPTEFGFTELDPTYVVSMHEHEECHDPRKAWEYIQSLTDMELLFGARLEQFRSVWWLYARRKDGQPVTPDDEARIHAACDKGLLPRHQRPGVIFADVLRNK